MSGSTLAWEEAALPRSCPAPGSGLGAPSVSGGLPVRRALPPAAASQAALPRQSGLSCVEASLWHPWNVRLPGSALPGGKAGESRGCLCCRPSRRISLLSSEAVSVSGTACEWRGLSRGGGAPWHLTRLGAASSSLGACNCPVLATPTSRATSTEALSSRLA